MPIFVHIVIKNKRKVTNIVFVYCLLYKYTFLHRNYVFTRKLFMSAPLSKHNFCALISIVLFRFRFESVALRAALSARFIGVKPLLSS